MPCVHSTPTDPASKAAGRPGGMVIQWHLSDACNLRCRHCYQPGYRRGDEELGLWLARLDEFSRFFRAFPARPRPRLTITGGEPLALAGIDELLDAVARHHGEFDFALLSNGTLIDDAVARRLGERHPAYVQVSLDGTEATHDAIRGEGSFARAVKGIRSLVDAGIQTLIAFTAGKDNYREFPEVARLGAELGVARVWSDRVIPEGQSGAGSTLSPEETRAYVNLIASASAQNCQSKTEIAQKRALQFLGGGHPAYFCKAATSLIAVLPNGDVLPCRRLPLVTGNVDVEPLAAIYDGEAMRGLRQQLQTPPACRPCLYATICRGGLRCLAQATDGNLHGRDPGCWLQPD